MMNRQLALKKQLLALSDELMGYSFKWQANAPHGNSLSDIDKAKEPNRWESERVKRFVEYQKNVEQYNGNMKDDYQKRFKPKVARLCAEARKRGLDIDNADTIYVENEGGPYSISRLLREAAHQL